ncbi:hypothetical protein ON010_g12384 [Phytophthora cinnamomi]|nr:hypothetical protein ON010_g12384 [Phytophthora cinnamomi]
MSKFDEWWHNVRRGSVEITSPVATNDSNEHSGESDGRVLSENCAAAEPKSLQDAESTGKGDDKVASDDRLEEAKVAIKLNVCAPVVGRPRVNRVQRRNTARCALKEYNKGMKWRALLRDKDVSDIVACLDEITPSLQEARSYLATHHVYLHSGVPAFTWEVDSDFVPDTVRYRLPEATVDMALTRLDKEKLVLNGGKPLLNEIEIDGESNEDNVVVVFEKIGKFTRDQLQAMKYLWNLLSICNNGNECCMWLKDRVKVLVDNDGNVDGVSEMLLNAWPYDSVPGVQMLVVSRRAPRLVGAHFLNYGAEFPKVEIRGHKDAGRERPPFALNPPTRPHTEHRLRS